MITKPEKSLNKAMSDCSPNCGNNAKPPFKTRFLHKALVFSGAVFALSWFFEGCRRMHAAVTLQHSIILAAGIIFTLLFVALQAFWIYAEEKEKGSLKKRIALFERIYEAI